MVPNPHDRLFKETFSRPEHAAALLRTSLPLAVLEHLDLGSLTLEPGSHVDGTLRERFTDLLFSARLSGREAYVYLCCSSTRARPSPSRSFIWPPMWWTFCAST